MSAVPATIDALVALFGSKLGRQVQVLDGPPTVDVQGDVVAVGLTPQEPADVDASEGPAGLRVVRESFTVLCLARSWSGDRVLKPQRDRTYRLVAGVKAVLQADPTLGGVVVQASFAGSTYTPWRENALLVVDVPFRVAVTALTD